MLPYAAPLLIYHPSFMQDTMPEEYLERAERLEVLMEDIPFIEKLLAQEEVQEGEIHARRATSGEKYLPLFHTHSYINQIKEICAGLRDREYTQLSESNETIFHKESYQLACYAVGAAIEAARSAKQGQKAFAVVRPPGHHAHANKSDGFCIFNNIAIAVEYLRRQKEKVLIIDTDLHHGDGTLSYVEGKKDLFYYSISQEKLWPHLAMEESENTFLLNLPESTTDEIYLRELNQTLPSLIEKFNPHIIAVSAGFDTFATDYVNYRDQLEGGFCLSPKVYKSLWDILDQTLIPYFAVLEGGYNPISVCTGVMTFFDKKR